MCLTVQDYRPEIFFELNMHRKIVDIGVATVDVVMSIVFIPLLLLL